LHLRRQALEGIPTFPFCVVVMVVVVVVVEELVFWLACVVGEMKEIWAARVSTTVSNESCAYLLFILSSLLV
jgi:hypothetical protein